MTHIGNQCLFDDIRTATAVLYPEARIPETPMPDVAWKPIETYPRDHDAAADTYWGPNALLFVPTGLVAPASDYRILTGRLEADMWLAWDNGGSMWDITSEPSHWMPLPRAPLP